MKNISRVGGSIPLVWTYFAEFQPAARRGGALSVLATFWMVGNVVVAGLAWAIIPHQVRHTAVVLSASVIVSQCYCLRSRPIYPTN